MSSDFEDIQDVARISIQAHRGALIASIQVELDARVLRVFQADLLRAIEMGSQDVAILDLSGVEIMDADDFEGFRRIVQMSWLMGTEVMLCGLQPGVAASLVELDVTVDDLATHRDLDAALAALAARQADAESSEPGPDATWDSEDNADVPERDPSLDTE
ncbi:MAG: STAS domain-containing protein [Planctomycetota bacterium]